MARKRKLDNLEKDVIAAMQLGYGVHYGRYKADHPNTMEEELPPKKVYTYGKTVICGRCGKHFSPRSEGRSHNSKYCSQACYYEAAKERARQWRARKG